MRKRRRKVLKSSQMCECEGWKLATIKVICDVCGARMINRKTNWQKTGVYADCYYTCTNVECSRTSVWVLNHHHDVTPSGLEKNGVMKELLSRLSPEERQMAIDFLQAG